MSSRLARTITEEKGHAALEVGARAAALLAAVILTAILGYGELMADSLPPEHALQDEVREIRKPAERAAALTNQLLAFSRPQVLDA